MAREVGNGSSSGSGYHRRASIATPYGEGRTLYPFDPDTDPSPILSLLAAVLRRARDDAAWLTALDNRPTSTWTPHEKRRRGRMLDDGIVPPTLFLSR